jgi:AcrR family transcriptional regulator
MMEIAKEGLMKANIIEAAKGLFQQYGLAKTTMEDIAKAIGKGKSSLYYYFATKEDIFEAVLFKEKADVFRQIEIAVSMEETAEEKLKVFAATIHNELNNKKGLILNIINSDSDIMSSMCLMSSVKKKYDTVELDLIKSILSYGIETGEFSAACESQLDTIALISISTLRGLQINCVFNENLNNNTKVYIDLYIDMLVKSLKQ